MSYERLDRLTNEARSLIRASVEGSKKPAVLCSFGKDSLVLLHLTRELGFRLPVIFHRLPYYAEKYSHADWLIREWELDVVDYMPARLSVVAGNELVDVVSHFRVKGGGEYLMPYANLEEPKDGQEFLCGAEAMLGRQTDPREHDSDVLFAGRKASDVDPVVGKLGLRKDDFLLSESARLVFPLKNWTDQDIWDYVERVELPIDTRRYWKDEDGMWREFEDKSANPDYLPCCTRCFNPSAGAEWVECPKKKMLIRSIVDEVPFRRVRGKDDIVWPPLLC